MDLAYKRLYAPLRNEVLHSIQELNQAIHRQLALLNAGPFKAKSGSRKGVFENTEKNLLQQLPGTRYLIRHVTYGKVQRNYHVIVGEDAHQYSVPFQLIGQRLKIIYTADLVEIYDGLKRVAFHTRSYRRNGYTTHADHRPVSHQHMIEQRGWDREYFLRQAATIGSSTTTVISKILDSKLFYEQTYNSCLGILRLVKTYTKERVEAACQRATGAPRVNYGIIESILKNHLDQSGSDHNNSGILPPQHDQIRGPENYQ